MTEEHPPAEQHFAQPKERQSAQHCAHTRTGQTAAPSSAALREPEALSPPLSAVATTTPGDDLGDKMVCSAACSHTLWQMTCEQHNTICVADAASAPCAVGAAQHVDSGAGHRRARGAPDTTATKRDCSCCCPRMRGSGAIGAAATPGATSASTSETSTSPAQQTPIVRLPRFPILDEQDHLIPQDVFLSLLFRCICELP